MNTLLRAGTELRRRYQVRRLISDEGGMARVYEVVNLADHPPSRWAMKELRGVSDAQEHKERLKLFKQEARLLKALDHRNVPRFCDHFQDRGQAYLVLEYIAGQPLDKLLLRQTTPFPEIKVLAWARQLCQVLDYLHAQTPPIIYRDLKPANVMVADDGTVKVIDFGIARTYKAGKRRDTQLMGTEAYAAPEQYGTDQSDARTDIYALGATMYHLLTKQFPPHAKLPGVPTPVDALNPTVSVETSNLIAKAMHKDQRFRFQSAPEMEQALAEIWQLCQGSQQAQPGHQVPASPPETCPSCSHPCRPGARFCPRCGTALFGLLPAVIRVIRPHGARWEMPVPKDKPLMIGYGSSHETAALDLSFYDVDGYVSRRHAKIEADEHRYLIQDLGSTNGTQVNEQPLRPHIPMALHNGDRIQAGRVVLLFSIA